MLDLCRDIEQHLAGGCLLHDVAIQGAADGQGLRVGQFVARDDPGAGGPVRVEALSHHHGGRTGLPVADGDVVAAHVARHDLQRALAGHVAAAPADHEAEFGLEVDLVGYGGDLDSGAGADDACRLLGEPDLVLGRGAARLADVVHVVEADREDLSWARNGGLEADLCEVQPARAAGQGVAGLGHGGVAAAQEGDHGLGQGGG